MLALRVAVKVFPNVALVALGLGCGRTQRARPQTTETLNVISRDTSRMDESALNDAVTEHSPYETDASTDVTPRSTAPVLHSVHGVTMTIEEGEWACFDKSGRRLATILRFDNGPDYAVEGFIRYKDGSKIGFVDEACKIRIGAARDFAFPFSDGLAVVCEGCRSQSDGEHEMMTGGQWGYIDRTGRVVVPLIYESATRFESGSGELTLNGVTYRVNRRGVVSPVSNVGNSSPVTGRPPPGDNSGRPTCVRIGTRSEGWAWPNGTLIHWAKCRGVAPTCYKVDSTHQVEGWYATGSFISAATCAAKH